jgi:hypothetical protein
MIMFLCWEVFIHKNMDFNRHVAPLGLGGVMTLFYRHFALTGLGVSCGQYVLQTLRPYRAWHYALTGLGMVSLSEQLQLRRSWMSVAGVLPHPTPPKLRWRGRSRGKYALHHRSSIFWRIWFTWSIPYSNADSSICIQLNKSFISRYFCFAYLLSIFGWPKLKHTGSWWAIRFREYLYNGCQLNFLALPQNNLLL